jgi:hypothetical protein
MAWRRMGRQGCHEGVVAGNEGSELLQDFQDREGGRLARVVDVFVEASPSTQMRLPFTVLPWLTGALVTR